MNEVLTNKVDNWDDYFHIENLVYGELDKKDVEEFISNFSPEVKFFLKAPSVSIYIKLVFSLLNYLADYYIDEDILFQIRKYIKALEMTMLIDRANIKIEWMDEKGNYSEYELNHDESINAEDLIAVFDDVRCDRVCVR